MQQSRRGFLTSGLSVAAGAALPAAAQAHSHHAARHAGHVHAAHLAHAGHHGGHAAHHGGHAVHMARAGRHAARHGGHALSTAYASPPPLRGAAFSPGVRIADVHNLHTGDRLKAVYFENGRYVPDAMSELMKVMRDWRSGEEHLMDPRLFDVMHALRGKIETYQPFQIISGYRSKATNDAMHEMSSQVAKNSQHTEGKASDVRVQGVDLRNLRAAALDLSAGGVGYYPVSNFVHVDVGPIRQWQGA